MNRFIIVTTLAGESVLLNISHIIAVTEGEKQRANIRVTPATGFPGTVYCRQSFDTVFSWLTRDV